MADHDDSMLYVAEYHIIPHTNPEIENSKIPPMLVNAKCKFGIYVTERAEYKDGKTEQYAKANSRSWRKKKGCAARMLAAINQEWAAHDARRVFQDYQYAGKWRLVGSNKGHNCGTWCEEKLEFADIKSSNAVLRFFGYFKAAPSKGAKPKNQVLDPTQEDLSDSDSDSDGPGPG